MVDSSGFYATLVEFELAQLFVQSSSAAASSFVLELDSVWFDDCPSTLISTFSSPLSLALVLFVLSAVEFDVEFATVTYKDAINKRSNKIKTTNLFWCWFWFS